MTTRGILRGGLLGAALAVAFSMLGVIPVCGFAALPFRILAFAAGGYFGARSALRGGGNGVIAGLGAGILAGIVDGLANIALAPVRFKLADDTLTSLHLLPVGVVGAFKDVGIDLMSMDTLGGSIFFSIILCGGLWLLGGALGALGGALAQALTE